MRAWILVLGLLLALPALAERPVARVSVSAAGVVSLDGRTATLPEVKSALRALAQKGGEVWYYRPNPEGEPPPGAMEVVQAIIDARLPVRLATKPDFSEFATFPASPPPSR